MQRRTFLEIGSSLATIPFMGAANNPHAPIAKQKTGEKAIVFIMLRGGISSVDSFHARPDFIQGKHTVNGAIQTKTEGLYVGADFENIAKITDKLNVVHNYGHRNANHYNATVQQMTGRPSIGLEQNEPGYGAFISKVYGPSNETNGIPLYMKIGNVEGGDGAWLGSAYNAYDAKGKNTDDLVLKLEPGRFAQRLKMLEFVDKGGGLKHNQIDSMNKLRAQAVNMISGNLKQAFDLQNEPDSIREKYGKNSTGDAFILARRLLQNQGKFITISVGSFDHHTNIANAMKQQVPPVDKAYTAFIQELDSLGMLGNVMVVMTSEFNRTIALNRDGGRDHNANLCSLIIAGSNVNQGRIIGQALRDMSGPDGAGFGPDDLSKTIFDHFGLANMRITDMGNRPRWIYDEDAKNIIL